MNNKMNLEICTTWFFALFSLSGIIIVFAAYPRMEQGYPAIAFGTMLISSVVYLYQIYAKKARVKEKVRTENASSHFSELWTKKENRNVIVTMAAAIAYILLMKTVGFVVISALFIILLPIYLGYRKPLPIILAAVICIGFVYFLFTRLYVPIPEGFLALLH